MGSCPKLQIAPLDDFAKLLHLIGRRLPATRLQVQACTGRRMLKQLVATRDSERYESQGSNNAHGVTESDVVDLPGAKPTQQFLGAHTGSRTRVSLARLARTDPLCPRTP